MSATGPRARATTASKGRPTATCDSRRDGQRPALASVTLQWVLVGIVLVALLVVGIASGLNFGDGTTGRGVPRNDGG